jgi:hypothetical protein
MSAPTPPTYRADAIVVLGRTPEPDGSLPPIGRQRVERAVALWRAGIAPRLILSGRHGLMVDDSPMTEAEGMARHALALGVPRELLHLEDESRDTIGNAYFVLRRWLEPNAWRTIRVVTSDFHVTRTAWVFQKILGDAYDVSFSPASTELDAEIIAARARAEGDITTFLMEWIGQLPDGDRDAIERLIRSEHPGYAEHPTVTREHIQRRIDEIGRVHRVMETHDYRGNRVVQERNAEL